MLNINSARLWRDEAFSALTVQLPVTEIIRISAADNQPPLYFLMLKLSGKFLGFSEIALRSWSILGMLLSLFFSYKIAQLYFKKAELAGWTLVLTAFNPVIILYAIEARAYALLIAATISASYFGLEYLKTQNKKWLILLTISLVVGMYLHNIFIIPCTVIFGSLVAESIRKNKGHNFMSYLQSNRLLYSIPLIVFIAFMPWIFNLLAQVGKISSDGFWYQFVPYRDFFSVITMLFITDQWSAWGTPLAYPVTMLTGLVVFSVFYGWFQEIKNSRSKLPILSILSLLPMLLIYLISFKIPLMYFRYLLFILPFLTMLIVLVWSKKQSVLAFLLVLMTISTIYRLVSLPSAKEDYPKLLSNIIFLQGHDAIVTHNAMAFHGLKYYSKYPIYIDAAPESIKGYDGKAILTAADYWPQDKRKPVRLWIPYIINWNQNELDSYRAKLTAEGYIENYNIKISQTLYLSLYTRNTIESQD